jgi:hypothetical protein
MISTSIKHRMPTAGKHGCVVRSDRVCRACLRRRHWTCATPRYSPRCSPRYYQSCGIQQDAVGSSTSRECTGPLACVEQDDPSTRPCAIDQGERRRDGRSKHGLSRAGNRRAASRGFKSLWTQRPEDRPLARTSLLAIRVFHGPKQGRMDTTQ